MGWITGEQAMAAIEGGQAEKITEGYDQDVAQGQPDHQPDPRRHRDGHAGTREEMIEVTDPITGMTQQMPEQVPMWMPNDWDNIPVWQQQLGAVAEDPGLRGARRRAPGARGGREADVGRPAAARSQEGLGGRAQQQQQAEQLGMGNAAAPQGPPTVAVAAERRRHARLRADRAAAR